MPGQASFPTPSDSSVVGAPHSAPSVPMLSLSHTCAHLVKKAGHRQGVLESLKDLILPNRSSFSPQRNESEVLSHSP